MKENPGCGFHQQRTQPITLNGEAKISAEHAHSLTGVKGSTLIGDLCSDLKFRSRRTRIDFCLEARQARVRRVSCQGSPSLLKFTSLHSKQKTFELLRVSQVKKVADRNVVLRSHDAPQTTPAVSARCHIAER